MPLQPKGRGVMRAVRFAVLLLGLVCGSLPAFAADKFPSRPIKFVVGFLAGGPNDIIARILCEWLSQHLGQPFIVENKAGAGRHDRGEVGDQFAARRLHDHVRRARTTPSARRSTRTCRSIILRDTTPVAGIMQLANIMVVPPSLPVKTVAEFIAYAKANPGKINLASSGNGTSVHMSGEMFKMMTGSRCCTCPTAARPASIPT